VRQVTNCDEVKAAINFRAPPHTRLTIDQVIGVCGGSQLNSPIFKFRSLDKDGNVLEDIDQRVDKMAKGESRPLKGKISLQRIL
jgi:hypothetical protein